jgi:hypothetical protein
LDVVKLTVRGSGINITEHRVQASDGRPLLIWSLYCIDGRPAAMNLQDRLLYGVSSLANQPTASVVAFATHCRENCEQARRLLEAFAMQALPDML